MSEEITPGPGVTSQAKVLKAMKRKLYSGVSAQ